MRERRVVDPKTGGEKGSKPERYDLVPAAAMDEVARVYGMGASKYSSRNWERGYDWGLSLAALHRHVKAFERREDYDAESGLHHLAHAVFHCLALMTYQANGLGTDSRSSVCKPVCKPSEPAERGQGAEPIWKRPRVHGEALAKAAEFWRSPLTWRDVRRTSTPTPFGNIVAAMERHMEEASRLFQDRRNLELYLDGAGKAISVIDPRNEPYGLDMVPELPPGV